MNSNLQGSNSDAKTAIPNQGERLPVNRYALFFWPLLIGAGLDLYTKSYVFSRYFDPLLARSRPPDVADHWWVDQIFGIQTSTNPGALFGFGKGYSTLFAAFSIVALVGIFVWLFPLRAARDRWLAFATGLISGGIIGNFYDRVGWGYVSTNPIEMKYSVRDWIYFRLEGVRFFDPWPNFNIADSVLVTGAIMLFLHAFLFATPQQRKEVAAQINA